MKGEYFSKAWDILTDDDQSWSSKHNLLVNELERVKRRRDAMRVQRMELESMELDVIAQADDVENLFSTFQRARQREEGS